MRTAKTPCSQLMVIATLQLVTGGFFVAMGLGPPHLGLSVINRTHPAGLRATQVRAQHWQQALDELPTKTPLERRMRDQLKRLTAEAGDGKPMMSENLRRLFNVVVISGGLLTAFAVLAWRQARCLPADPQPPVG